jgi:hypothetical protein
MTAYSLSLIKHLMMVMIAGISNGEAGIRDEETIVYPLILAFCFLTFVAQRVAYPDMRPFKRLGEKTDCCV